MFFYCLDMMNLLSLVYGNESMGSHFQSQHNPLVINLKNLESSNPFPDISKIKSFLVFTDFQNGTLLAKTLKVWII